MSGLVRAGTTAILLAAGLASCYRERREFESPPSDPAASTARRGGLRPGAAEAVQDATRPASQATRYEDNAYAVSQGKRLFRWFNCNGCHAAGGGDIGPALMDEKWLYGGQPGDIYASIVEGRPNGMPSFGGRITPNQVWQIVAYVRSMSGQLRKDVAPSRADSLSGAPPENTREEMKPAAPQAAASKP